LNKNIETIGWGVVSNSSLGSTTPSLAHHRKEQAAIAKQKQEEQTAQYSDKEEIQENASMQKLIRTSIPKSVTNLRNAELIILNTPKHSPPTTPTRRKYNKTYKETRSTTQKNRDLIRKKASFDEPKIPLQSKRKRGSYPEKTSLKRISQSTSRQVELLDIVSSDEGPDKDAALNAAFTYQGYFGRVNAATKELEHLQEPLIKKFLSTWRSIARDVNTTSKNLQKALENQP
jgi:hypothetical protein